MTSIGETLRSERLRRGWTLKQISAETKISSYLLEALEADQFDRLPCALLTRSFLRQYARFLEIDEKAALVSLKQQLDELGPSIPEPKLGRGSGTIPLLPPIKFQALSKSSLSAFLWLLFVVLACSKVYTVWRHGWETRANAVALGPHPAPPPMRPAPKPELYLADGQRSPAGSGAGASLAAPKADGEIRVALKATEPVWISIKSDGMAVHSETLQPQQTREFDGTNKMMVIVGNAGGLEMTVNGKSVGPIGPHGEIRLLELTPAGARIVPRSPHPGAASAEGATLPN